MEMEPLPQWVRNVGFLPRWAWRGEHGTEEGYSGVLRSHEVFLAGFWTCLEPFILPSSWFLPFRTGMSVPMLVTSLCVQFSSVQSLSHVWLFATPWIAARQASLSITNSQSLLKLMSIETVMPSNHLILCCPLLLLPPIPPSIRVFFNESTLRMRWPKYWSFSFSISPSNEHPELISFRVDWLDLLVV